MCNLNLIFRTTLEEKNLTSFLSNVTANSYAGNNDGDGIFCKNKLTKGLNKVDIFPLENDINLSKVIISHQRRSTSGFDKQWTQPFKSEEFVLAHNGIMNDFLGKSGSDTWGFFLKFLKQFKKEKGSREDKLIKAVKKLLDNNSKAYYSIVILDRVTKISYYFKNPRANIYGFVSESMIYLTTNSFNGTFLTLLNEKFKEMIIEDYVIYRISIENEISFLPVGKIIMEPIKETKKEKKRKEKRNQQKLLKQYAYDNPWILNEDPWRMRGYY